MAEIAPTRLSPWKSPSYPDRIHVNERARWNALLKQWDERIKLARAELVRAGADPERLLLFGRMLGARDQLADAARRLPMEVGPLYKHDHHRLENAVAALERLFARWPASPRKA